MAARPDNGAVAGKFHRIYVWQRDVKDFLQTTYAVMAVMGD